MNTVTTALGSGSSHRVARMRARRFHERLAARAGLALLAWSRPVRAELSHEEVAHQRRLAYEAAQLHSALHADLALRVKAA